jgi:hypothetical protein
MRGATADRYISCINCLFSFLLRIERGLIDFDIQLTGPVSNAAKTVINGLSSGTIERSDIHLLSMAVLQEVRDPSVTTPSACVLFIIFKNVMLSGMIRYPENISGTLSELKWPFRATAFHEIYKELKKGHEDCEADNNNFLEDSILRYAQIVPCLLFYATI